MTDKKVIEALDHLKEMLPRGVPEFLAKRIDPSVLLDVDGFPPVPAHQHLLFMMTEIREQLALGQREKAFRWLGFLQGAVWAFGLTNLDLLKEMNKPEAGRGIMDVG